MELRNLFFSNVGMCNGAPYSDDKRMKILLRVGPIWLI